MKISELKALASLEKAATIPVALLGENRSITIGQLVEALQSSIVPFGAVMEIPSDVGITYADGNSGTGLTPIWDTRTRKFYGMSIKDLTTYYTNFAGQSSFYDDKGNVRQDCLFIAASGRLYYFNGSNLISAGITDAQAELLVKLTPKKVASESILEAMKKVGEIVPGQIYYIPETD